MTIHEVSLPKQQFTLFKRTLIGSGKYHPCKVVNKIISTSRENAEKIAFNSKMYKKVGSSFEDLSGNMYYLSIIE